MTEPTLPIPELEPGSANPTRLIAAHEQATEFYRWHLLHTDGPCHYLARRGMAILARPNLPWRTGIDLPWRVGYAPPGWTTLIDHLTTTGYTPTEVHAAGLATRTRNNRLIDTFRDRIVLPIRNRDGHVVALIGRASPAAGADTPKYLNSRDSVIYHKGQTLYGLAEQYDRLNAGWAPVIVEGPFDTLAAWLAHPDTIGTGRVALAPCGTSLTINQAATICALPGAARHGVTVAFDNDSAGLAAADRAFQLLSAHQGTALHSARLPDGTDPGDLITHPDAAAALRAALTYQTRSLAEAAIDHRITDLLTHRPRLLMEIPGQIYALRAVAPVLTRVPPPEAVRLLQYVADVTGNPVEIVTRAVVDVFDQEHAAWEQAHPFLSTAATTPRSTPPTPQSATKTDQPTSPQPPLDPPTPPAPSAQRAFRLPPNPSGSPQAQSRDSRASDDPDHHDPQSPDCLGFYVPGRRRNLSNAAG